MFVFVVFLTIFTPLNASDFQKAPQTTPLSPAHQAEWKRFMAPSKAPQPQIAMTLAPKHQAEWQWFLSPSLAFPTSQASTSHRSEVIPQEVTRPASASHAPPAHNSTSHKKPKWKPRSKHRLHKKSLRKKKHIRPSSQQDVSFKAFNIPRRNIKTSHTQRKKTKKEHLHHKPRKSAFQPRTKR